ncbi:MBL fold metallo-hydrolase [Mucilaginibacter sp. JRF]|uniref:MBL fold metallo-hydrolase n=1 Tax=Mucilaginibacter sp. JRF TaxID=2780088 RepID=UPI00187E6B2E|nr:MBL fold metallo-hydrolase [Mucilaginibacter sp. JRF]MBE9583292.1 MBL fold metallo-hydrolase [Mucilaginibacter sp. JRF]
MKITDSWRILAIFLLFILLYIPFGCGIVPSLGKNPEDEALDVIRNQPNYKNGQFQNLSYDDDTTAIKRSGIWKQFFNKPDSVSPPRQLPWVKTNLKTLPDARPVVVWFGHSSVLIKYRGINMLIDPIFSSNAGPVPGLIKAFNGATHYNVEDMPPIDVVIISHDHYDHLDYRTLKKLRNQVKKVVVPLGVGSHLKYWGYKPEQIVELNWHGSYKLPDGSSVTAAPARHRSNRTLKMNQTLWASYVIRIGDHRIFYSGDSGFGHHFKAIGSQYGPFDLAVMECGQYGPNWPHSHMFPTQTAQAASDLQTDIMQPVHWAKFAESSHIWNEPVRQLLPAAEKLGITVITPYIGEPYVIGTTPVRKIWWEL